MGLPPDEPRSTHSLADQLSAGADRTQHLRIVSTPVPTPEWWSAHHDPRTRRWLPHPVVNTGDIERNVHMAAFCHPWRTCRHRSPAALACSTRFTLIAARLHRADGRVEATGSGQIVVAIRPGIGTGTRSTCIPGSRSETTPKTAPEDRRRPPTHRVIHPMDRACGHRLDNSVATWSTSSRRNGPSMPGVLRVLTRPMPPTIRPLSKDVDALVAASHEPGCMERKRALSSPYSTDGWSVASAPPGRASTPGMDGPFRRHDVDQVADRVVKTGGRIVGGPMDVMDAVRLVACADPSGAVSASSPSVATRDAGRAVPGAYAWSELATTDLAAAVASTRPSCPV